MEIEKLLRKKETELDDFRRFLANSDCKGCPNKEIDVDDRMP